MPYTVGNLELNIASSAKTAVKNLDTLLSKLNKVKGALNISSKNGLSGIGKGSKQSSFNGLSNKNQKLFSFAGVIGKFGLLINRARVYSRYIQNIVQYAADYQETQNLWQVAMRDNISQAREFVRVMNTAYGISEATLMNYQAIFKNMLSALGGISETVSYNLSEQLTQMALDFASLYNVSIESAMNKFQSVVSGQVRPIRSVSGYEITEGFIYDLYTKAGGTKMMRQLSQLEKRLLRIYAVYGQEVKTGAVGDMAKTIESSANQMRIFTELLKESLTWLGQFGLMVLQNTQFFQKLNGALIVTREILKSFAVALGYQDTDWLQGLFGGMKDGAEEAEDAVNGLMGLLSFDKFEALSSNKQTADIDKVIADMIASMKLATARSKMQAQSFAEEWLTALGYVYDEEDKLWKNTELDIDDIIKKVKEWATGLSGISLLMLAIKHPILSLIGAMAYLYATNEDIRASINQTIKELTPALVQIGNAIFKILIQILPFISNILINVSKFITYLDEVGALIPVLWALVGVFVAIKLAQLAMNIAALANPYVLIFMAVIALATVIIAYFDEIGAWFEETGKAISDWFENIGNTMTNWFNTFDERMNAWADGVVIKLKNVLVAIGNFFANIGIGIANLFIGFVNVCIGFINTLITPITKIGKLFGENWSIPSWDAKVEYNPIKGYATGGFPEDGLFMANSNELVGGFNGKTAVANNEQIVQGIREGVYSAVMAAMAQSGNKSRSGDVYIDGQKVGKVVENSVYGEGVRVGHFGK